MTDSAIEVAAVDWISMLPSYQRELIGELRQRLDYEDVARAWLEAGAAFDTAPFSASGSTKVFFDKFLDELHDLLCTGDKYGGAKQNALKELGAGKTTAAAYLSQQISPHLGASESVLAPVVAVILCLIGTVGLRAWCQTQTQRRKGNGSSGAS